MSSGRIDFADDAPEVNYDVCVVENRGLAVVDHPNLGRTVQATKDLSVRNAEDSIHQYTPILREKPALVCPQDDYMAFMEAFLDAPLQVQLGILDMFYQPLDSPMGKSLLEPTRLLYFLGVLEDDTVIHQLLCILMTNGHQYSGDQVALVIFGSKFSHSCDPNAAYSSTAEDGCLEYLLLDNDGIKAGEEVTFSYLSDLFETPTIERRQLLWQTKSFICRCPRCLGPDYCRCIQCPSCNTPVSCTYIQKLTNISTAKHIQTALESCWKCSKCGTPTESVEMEAKERAIERLLQVVDQQITARKNFDPSGGTTQSNSIGPSFVQGLVQQCTSKLSSTHYLTIKALRQLISISTSHAYVIIKQNLVRGSTDVLNFRVSSYLRTSVLSGIQLVLAGECIAAKCTGCYLNENRSTFCFSICHDPHFDRATPMRHVVEELLTIPIYMWPSNGLEMAHRYLPTLCAKFKKLAQPKRSFAIASHGGQSPKNHDIDLLHQVEVCWKNLRCWECDRLIWDAKVESVVIMMDKALSKQGMKKSKSKEKKKRR